MNIATSHLIQELKAIDQQVARTDDEYRAAFWRVADATMEDVFLEVEASNPEAASKVAQACEELHKVIRQARQEALAMEDAYDKQRKATA
jgi:Holliday junction resolvasome RuvABC endonuclease subunit